MDNGCGTSPEDFSGIVYEGEGPAGPSPDREETRMESTRNPFAGVATPEGDGYGFERWLQRRQRQAETNPTDDALYAAALEQMTGGNAQERAGVVSSGTEGRGADFSAGDEVDDDQAYQALLDVMSGAAGRRQAEEASRQHALDMEREAVRNAKHYGLPLARNHEHLRGELEAYGYQES